MSVEMDQVSGSHAVLTLVHLDAQPEPDPVSDIAAGPVLSATQFRHQQRNLQLDVDSQIITES